MPIDKQFKCPQCGGRYFGVIMVKDLVTPLRIDCHCATDGESFSGRPAVRLKPCGWSSSYDADAPCWRSPQ